MRGRAKQKRDRTDANCQLRGELLRPTEKHIKRPNNNKVTTQLAQRKLYSFYAEENRFSIRAQPTQWGGGLLKR